MSVRRDIEDPTPNLEHISYPAKAERVESRWDYMAEMFESEKMSA